jgi:hypothetical protein
MPNDKNWLASNQNEPANGQTQDQSSSSTSVSGASTEPEHVEGLRLIRAFLRIADPRQRATLIDSAEKMATQ